jgi:hypothetical protein
MGNMMVHTSGKDGFDLAKPKNDTDNIEEENDVKLSIVEDVIPIETKDKKESKEENTLTID